MLDGLRLRDIDQRRAQLNQATYTASLTNADKPKKAVRTFQNELDKEEREITENKKQVKRRKPTAAMLKKINKLFGN